MIDRFNKNLDIRSGRKFDKVVSNGSVWGFVAKTNGVLKGIPYFVGDVFKPAGWSAPNMLEVLVFFFKIKLV